MTNLHEVLRDLDGVELPSGKDAESLTLKTVLLRSLLLPLPGDEKLPAEEKFKAGLLAQRVHGSDDTSKLTAEEIALIKKRVGVAYPQLVVLRVWSALDPACNPAG